MKINDIPWPTFTVFKQGSWFKFKPIDASIVELKFKQLKFIGYHDEF